MKKDSKRFIKVYEQGVLTVFQIWVDKETGVNYLRSNEFGITPLVDSEGKVIVTKNNVDIEEK